MSFLNIKIWALQSIQGTDNDHGNERKHRLGSNGCGLTFGPAMAFFDDIGKGWTLTEALEVYRKVAGPDSQMSYQTEPLRIVPCDLALRWGLMVVSLLDETADFVFRKPEWRTGISPWAP